MPLKLNDVKAAEPREKDYKLYDSKGLYLHVKPNGSKYWRMRYTFGGKEKLLALGVYPDLTLTEARELRDEARAKIKTGIDPMAQRAAIKAAPGSPNITMGGPGCFEFIAREWMALRTGKAESAELRTKNRLERDVFPFIGLKPASEVTREEVQNLLQRVAARGSIESAHRIKRVIGQIYRYAIITGRATIDPSEHMQQTLPAYKPKHFAAITEPVAFGKLLVAMDHYRGGVVVRAALQLSALWFMRPGELRRTQWSEVKWDDARVEVPGSRTKTGEDLIIPISRQAEVVLKDLYRITGNTDWLFPSPRSNVRCVSENATLAALRSIGYTKEEHTPHGFRASARTLLAEVLEYPDNWIEQQLNHAVRDVHGRAYNRTSFLQQRREMMQRWADYLDELREKVSGRNVVAGDFSAKSNNES